MANGTHALRLVAPELPSTSAPPSTHANGGIEHQIGEATADAAVTLAASMLQFHANGRMTPETKEAGGDKLARLAHLCLDTYGEIDFDAIARKEGLQQLRKFLDADPDFRRRVTGPPWRHGGGEATLAILVDGVLEIVDRVVRLERALRAN